MVPAGCNVTSLSTTSSLSSMADVTRRVTVAAAGWPPGPPRPPQQSGTGRLAHSSARVRVAHDSEHNALRIQGDRDGTRSDPRLVPLAGFLPDFEQTLLGGHRIVQPPETG